MNRLLTAIAAFAACALTFTTPASAKPVNWVINGVYSPIVGVQYTGSFTYDADTGIFSNQALLYSNVLTSTTYLCTVTVVTNNTLICTVPAPVPNPAFTLSGPLTNAGGALIIGGSSVAFVGNPASFGTVNIGQSVTQTYTFTLHSGGALAATPYVALTKGAQNLDFQAAATQPSNACVSGHSYSAGDTCSVSITFSPTKPYQRIGAVQLMGSAGAPIAVVNLTGTGVGPQVAFPSNLAVAKSFSVPYPQGVAVDGNGNIIVADSNSEAVYKIVPGLALTVQLASNFSFPGPIGVAVDGSGNVYVASNYVYEIVAVNGVVSSTSSVIQLASSFPWDAPTGVAVDGNGNVFLAGGQGSVREIVAVDGMVLAGSSVVTLPNGGAFSEPRAIAVDGSGNVYFTDFFDQTVKEIVAVNGAVTASSTVLTLPSGSGFLEPRGVAVDGLGNVFVVDIGHNALKEIVAVNGVVLRTSAVVTLASGLNLPFGVAVDDSENLFFSDTYNHLVKQIEFASPPSITFPDTNAGSQSAAQSVTVQNIGNASLNQTSLVESTNFAQVAGSGTPDDCPAATGTLAAGASCNLSLAFAPTTGGSLSGAATLTNNNLNVSGATQAINLSGTGLYNITVNTVPSGLEFQLNGIVYRSPHTVALAAGTYTLTGDFPNFIPSPGPGSSNYTFSSWGDGNTAGTRSIIVSGDATYTATYNARHFLDVLPNPFNGGTITGGYAYYDAGSSVTISAVANPGYHFTGWSGASTSTSSTTSITMTGPLRATANFAVGDLTYNVTVNTVPSGQDFELNGRIYTAPQTIALPAGTYTLFALTQPGHGTGTSQYKFSSWSDGNTSDSRSITVSRDATYTAAYNLFHYLSAFPNPPEGGTITGGFAYFAAGSSVTLTATANPGYHFTGWSEASTSTSPTTSITMTGPLTARANFAVGDLTYNITVNTVPSGLEFQLNGIVYRSPHTVALAAGTYTLTGDFPNFIPSPGPGSSEYTFSSWGDGNTAGTRSIIVSGDATYTATYNARHFLDIFWSPPEGGTITGGYGYYAAGSSVTISAVANPGYHFTGWSGASTSTSSTTSITMTGPLRATANFAVGSAPVSFGSVNIGQSVTQTYTFTIPSAGTLASTPYVALTKGAQNLDFQAAASQPSDACVTGHSYSAGDTCSVNVTFTPTKPYQRLGALQLMGSTGAPIATFNLAGIGVGPQVSFPSNGSLKVLPGDFTLKAFGVAVDGSGNVFFGADNGAVKKIVAVNGVVSSNSAVVTVGTNLQPNGLAMDGAGNIFVADYADNTVKEIVAVNGAVSASSSVITVSSGFSHPAGLAVDGSGNVFVADYGNNSVKEIVAVNGTVSPSSNVIAVGSGFSNPGGVAVDSAGNVFVADTNNHLVKEILAVGGAVSDNSRVISVGSGFGGPSGVAVDGLGDLFVADPGSDSVKEIVADNGSVSTASSVITLGSGGEPNSVAVDGAGNVFVADLGTNVMTEIDFSDAPSLTFSSTNTGSQSAAQSVTVQNIGNAPLSETSLIESSNFAQVPGSGTPADCPATTGTLAAGASCNISLVFAPATGGSLTGTATLTNNNLNVSGATQAISLSGTSVTSNYSVTVNTSPSGLSFTLDGTTYTAPQTLSLAAGTHSLSTTATQGTGGTEYTFSKWNDNGLASHTIAVSGTATYTATFNTLYNLTVAASPTAGGTVTGSGYFAPGSSATITATPNAGYAFTGWTGAATSTSSSTSVTMTGPLTATANFQQAATSFVTGYALTNPSLRNDFSGWVGMQITAGSNPLTLTSLGRACIAGNGASHVVKLVNASDSIDVLGGTVTVNMAGCTGGQFVFSPVSLTLPAGASYFLISQETGGGDQWYNYSTITTTTVAAVNGIVYSTNGSNYSQYFIANNSYVPVSFQYATGVPSTQFALTTTVSPSGGGTITANPSAPGGLYNTGTTVQLTANPAPYCTFVNWSGALSGSANSQSVTMSSALSVTANFTCAPPPTSPLLTGFALNNPSKRNDFSGFVGMKLTVGVNPLTVTSLGRVCIAGNSQTHTVKLVNVGTNADVPNSTVSVNMAGCTPGQFAYTPVSLTLPSGNAYYLVSNETSGGDKWYDYGQVSPTSAATVNGSVYYYFGSYIEVNVPNTSYVPVNLQYGVVTQTQYLLTTNVAPPGGGSITASPSAPGNYYNSGASVQLTAVPAAGCSLTNWSGGLSGTVNPQSISMTQAQTVTANFQCSAQTKTSFLTGFDQTATLRNDFGSWVGMKLTVGSNPLTVLSLGRVCLAGNSGMHTVKLVNPADGSDVPGGTVTVNMANCTPGSFMYTALPAPLTLPAGGNYYLASLETAGGDQWYDHSPVASTNVAAVNGAVYFYAGNWFEVNAPNQAYVPVSFQY